MSIFQCEWQSIGAGTGLNMPTQAACSCRFDNLTVHHVYFEPTVGIIPNRIKGWNFSLCRRDFPLPPPINRIGFDGLMEEQSGSKNQKKPASSPVFSAASLSLSTVLSATPSHAATSSSTTLSTTLIPLHRKLLLFPPRRQQPINTTIFVFFLLQYRQQQHRLLHRRRHQLQGD